MGQFANYLFEVGMLNRTPRSGFQFLGTGEQSVAEHTNRMLHVAFTLARMSDAKIDELHLLRLVLFHDLPEARTGDHNYLNRKYVHEDLERLLAETARAWPFGDWITPLLARVKTEAGKKLAQEILATRWDAWWFNDKNDPHWVNGNKRLL